MARSVPVDAPHQCPQASVWDAQSVESWKRAHLYTHMGGELVDVAVRMLLGVEASEVSLLYFLWYANGAGGLQPLLDIDNGAQEQRISGGTAQLCDRLAAEVSATGRGWCVRNAPVRAVEEEEEEKEEEEEEGEEAEAEVDAMTTAAAAAGVGGSCGRGHQGGGGGSGGGGGGGGRSGSAPSAAAAPQVGRVRVRSDAGTFTASLVVSAIPPKQTGRIHFQPPMPKARRDMVDRVFVGNYTKVVAFFETCFWRDNGLSGNGIRCNPQEDELVVGVYDYTQPDGKYPGLVCFISGDPALMLDRNYTAGGSGSASASASASASGGGGGGGDAADLHAARHAHIVRYLVRVFGPQAAHPTRVVSKAWGDDEWAGGCPVTLAPPGAFEKHCQLLLGAPFGRVHFAGTETATRWPGYMEGALDAAVRVANEVALRLDAERTGCATAGGTAGEDLAAAGRKTGSTTVPQHRRLLQQQLSGWVWNRPVERSGTWRRVALALAAAAVAVAAAVWLGPTHEF
jgi:monoamine oxidase